MSYLESQTSSIRQQNQEALRTQYRLYVKGYLSLNNDQITAAQALQQPQSNGVHELAAVCYSNKNRLPAADSFRTV